MKAILVGAVICISTLNSFAQPAKKSNQKEKAPTQEEMQKMLQEAQQMLNDMSPEDKKMMDSMGIQMPDMKQMQKNASVASDAQLAKAWEDENRIVPAKNAAGIAFASQQIVTAANVAAYVQKMNTDVLTHFTAQEKADCEQAYQWINNKTQGNATAIANAAVQLWMLGKYKGAIYILGKIITAKPDDNSLNNYAAFITMAGAEQWAVPLLNYLDKTNPQNSTILNNLSQAWFGLGEITKADEYAKKTLVLCAWHPQANTIKSKIAESKGNTAEAVSFAKKAVEQSYSIEKEERLRKLGYKMKGSDYPLPKKSGNDPLNLGGFAAPEFPKSVDDCIANQWGAFRDVIRTETEQLKKQLQDATDMAATMQQKRMNSNLTLIKTSMSNGRKMGDLNVVPMYAAGAGKMMNDVMEEYMRKTSALMKRTTDFVAGPGNDLKKKYDAEMERLRKEDLEQTGEGKPNKDYCPKYKETSNQFLLAYNGTLETFYKEHVLNTKVYLNDMAHWQMYAAWPEQYEVFKLNDKLEWLRVLSDDVFGFQEITQYKCEEKPGSGKKLKLAKFKEPYCKDKSTMNLGWGSMTSNCYETVTKLDIDIFGVKLFAAELKQNDENIRDVKDFGDYLAQSFVSCTIEAGPSKGAEIGKGPFKLEAEVGIKGVIEIGREGITDVGVKVEATVKATASEVKELPTGELEDVGAKPELTLIGTEAKLTVNSGFSVEGKGILSLLNKN